LGQNVNNNVQGNEQFFRSIFENAQIGISFFNIDGSTVFSNRALHEMLGYTGEELSHFETWDKIIHSEDRAVGAERYPRPVQGERDNDEWEQHFVRRDGSIGVANGRFSVLRDAAGMPQYVASFTEDIRESKRTQEEGQTRRARGDWSDRNQAMGVACLLTFPRTSEVADGDRL
jgi:PAS domain S-box-containing protein